MHRFASSSPCWWSLPLFSPASGSGATTCSRPDPRCPGAGRRGGGAGRVRLGDRPGGQDNQVVKVGDVLMRIDQERYQANLEQARAVAETRHQQYLLRQNEAARRSRLGIGAISAEDKENAQINAAIARSEYQEALAQVKIAELNLKRSELRCAQRTGDQPAPGPGQLRHGGPGGDGAGRPAVLLCGRLLRGNQAARHPRRHARPGPPDERRSADRRHGGEHQQRYHRPQLDAGRPVAGQCRADLQLGAPGAAHSGAHPPRPGAGGCPPERRDDRQRHRAGD